MKFGDNLKNMRKKNNLSQEELAEKVGVSRQSVSKWETGDAYPEMNNLLELCKIFKCNINDLVNDSILDVNSLDEEVLEKVVLLKKEQQKNVKTLSKIIMVISRIVRILLILGGVILGLTLVGASIAAFNLEISDNEAKLFGARVEVLENDKKLEIEIKGHKVLIADEMSANTIKEFLSNNSKYTIIGYTILCLVSLIIYIIILYKVLKYLDKLFSNIYEGETPFTLENVKLIKSMAIHMIVAIIVSNVLGAIGNAIISIEETIDFELFDLIEILFLYSLSYIFEYGYYMQKGTNAVMYGDEHE